MANTTAVEERRRRDVLADYRGHKAVGTWRVVVTSSALGPPFKSTLALTSDGIGILQSAKDLESGLGVWMPEGPDHFRIRAVLLHHHQPPPSGPVVDLDSVRFVFAASIKLLGRDKDRFNGTNTLDVFDANETPPPAEYPDISLDGVRLTV